MRDHHDHIRELTRPHTLTERITTTTGTTTITTPHTIKVPALIDQLGNADPAASNGDHIGGGYASKPTANIEALDTLIRIDLDAAAWVRDLGEDDPGDTKACLRLLGSLLPSCMQVQVDAITRDIRRWWTRARVATGWDQPPMKPDNTCPLCSERGTLRIRVLDTGDATAYCTSCEEVWDPDHIGLLAEHIRWENSDEPLEAS